MKIKHQFSRTKNMNGMSTFSYFFSGWGLDGGWGVRLRVMDGGRGNGWGMSIIYISYCWCRLITFLFFFFFFFFNKLQYSCEST